MSSPSQVFQSHLSALKPLCQRANPDPRALQSTFLALQQIFQDQILPLATARAAEAITLQPLLTELNRTLRLLAMDVAFLQTARQPATQQQRQRQMIAKVAQIETFAQAIQRALDPMD